MFATRGLETRSERIGDRHRLVIQPQSSGGNELWRQISHPLGQRSRGNAKPGANRNHPAVLPRGPQSQSESNLDPSTQHRDPPTYLVARKERELREDSLPRVLEVEGRDLPRAGRDRRSRSRPPADVHPTKCQARSEYWPAVRSIKFDSQDALPSKKPRTRSEHRAARSQQLDAQNGPGSCVRGPASIEGATQKCGGIIIHPLLRCQDWTDNEKIDFLIQCHEKRELFWKSPNTCDDKTHWTAVTEAFNSSHRPGLLNRWQDASLRAHDFCHARRQRRLNGMSRPRAKADSVANAADLWTSNHNLKDLGRVFHAFPSHLESYHHDWLTEKARQMVLEPLAGLGRKLDEDGAESLKNLIEMQICELARASEEKLLKDLEQIPWARPNAVTAHEKSDAVRLSPLDGHAVNSGSYSLPSTVSDSRRKRRRKESEEHDPSAATMKKLQMLEKLFRENLRNGVKLNDSRGAIFPSVEIDLSESEQSEADESNSSKSFSDEYLSDESNTDGNSTEDDTPSSSPLRDFDEFVRDKRNAKPSEGRCGSRRAWMMSGGAGVALELDEQSGVRMQNTGLRNNNIDLPLRSLGSDGIESSTPVIRSCSFDTLTIERNPSAETIALHSQSSGQRHQARLRATTTDFEGATLESKVSILSRREARTKDKLTGIERKIDRIDKVMEMMLEYRPSQSASAKKRARRNGGSKTSLARARRQKQALPLLRS